MTSQQTQTGATAPACSPSTTPSSTPLTPSFTCFPRLAPELQDLIWTHALPPSRTIRLKVPSPYKSPYPRLTPDYSTGLVPVILHVCKQSRDLAKLTYKWAAYPGYTQRVLWVDFNKDTLVMLYWSQPALPAPRLLPGMVSMMDHLQYLAVPHTLDSDAVGTIHCFTKLKDIVFYEAPRVRRTMFTVPSRTAATLAHLVIPHTPNMGSRAHMPTLSSFRTIGFPDHPTLLFDGSIEEGHAGDNLMLDSPLLRAVSNIMQNAFNTIGFGIGPPSEQLFLQCLTDNAKNNNVVGFKLPKVKYLHKAEFDHQYGALPHSPWASYLGF